MKAKVMLFTSAFLSCTLSIFAQSPLVGVWEYQVDTLKSTKIITPTHWIVFTESIKDNSAKFIRSQGGTYTRHGNKYVESSDVASWDDYGKEKTDYTFKVEGNKFYQKGILTLADGTQVPIDEVWQKVKSAKPNANNQAGTWEQLSSTTIMADGRKTSLTTATATRFHVATPTHWMRISHRNNKFEQAMGGTYTTEGNKLYPRIEYASFPVNKSAKIEITNRFAGNKMYWNGFMQDADGKTLFTFQEVFQRINGKVKKTTAVK